MARSLVIGPLVRKADAHHAVFCSLENLVHSACQLQEVLKKDLSQGDWVLVRTLRSVYSIKVLGGGYYSVSGGYFDSRGDSPVRTTISGCTWGGSIIKVDVIAACGLCIEFGNRVITSIIQSAVILPGGCEN